MAGLRLMEAARLRVRGVDFDYTEILVRDGKGRRTGEPSCRAHSRSRHVTNSNG
jgi:hypothetical protein